MSDTWYEVEEEEPEEGVSFSEYDISASPNDFNITTLNSFIGSGVVEIPGFQRNYIWDLRRASKLIESILIGIPIPQIFLYEEAKNKFLVIDGQQRYMTIYYFMKKRFPVVEKRVELRRIFLERKGIPDEVLNDDAYFMDFSLDLPAQDPSPRNIYDGKNYFTLPDEAKATFDMRTIRNIIIKQNFPKDDDSVIYEVFNRLNSGGVNLTQQEIRSSMYHSDFYEMVSMLNIRREWREILQQPEPDLHMKDIEVIFRAFAILKNHETYKPPMNKFINAFSKESKKFSQERISYFERLFLRFLELCSTVEASVFFSKQRKFNISILESVFYAACSDAFDSNTLDVKTFDGGMIEGIRNDEDFSKAITFRTTGTGNVRTRLRIAKQMIK